MKPVPSYLRVVAHLSIVPTRIFTIAQQEKIKPSTLCSYFCIIASEFNLKFLRTHLTPGGEISCDRETLERLKKLFPFGYKG